MPNSATLKNCDQCPLVVPCLARGGLEIRVCNVCRGAFYGEKVGDDFFSRGPAGAVRPLHWGRRARPIGNGQLIPCFYGQLAAFQNRIEKYRQKWSCNACAYRKYVDISFKVDFQDSPHIVSEPADLQICRKGIK
jgi:hypothetical protein